MIAPISVALREKRCLFKFLKIHIISGPVCVIYTVRGKKVKRKKGQKPFFLGKKVKRKKGQTEKRSIGKKVNRKKGQTEKRSSGKKVNRKKGQPEKRSMFAPP